MLNPSRCSTHSRSGSRDERLIRIGRWLILDPLRESGIRYPPRLSVFTHPPRRNAHRRAFFLSVFAVFLVHATRNGDQGIRSVRVDVESWEIERRAEIANDLPRALSFPDDAVFSRSDLIGDASSDDPPRMVVIGDASQHREREIAGLGKSDTSFGGQECYWSAPRRKRRLPNENSRCEAEVLYSISRDRLSLLFDMKSHTTLTTVHRLCNFSKIDVSWYNFFLQKIIVL